ERIDAARAEVAALIGAQPGEIIFTSGATEANNLALFGVAHAARRAQGAQRESAQGAQRESAQGAQRETALGKPAPHIVTSRIEHKSVLDAVRQLEKEGFAITLVE